MQGNHGDPKNYMQWDYIKLKLSGDPLYNPSKSRVLKWNDSIQKIAGNTLGFIYDL